MADSPPPAPRQQRDPQPSPARPTQESTAVPDAPAAQRPASQAALEGPRLDELQREVERLRAELQTLRQEHEAFVAETARWFREAAEEHNRLRIHVFGLRSALLPYLRLVSRVRSLTGLDALLKLAARLRRGYPSVLGELRRGQAFGQTFTVHPAGATERPVLAGVAVQLATFSRPNTCTVQLALYESVENRAPLRVATVSAEDLQDNAYHLFSFDPLPVAAGQSYYFELTSPDGTRGNAITAYFSPDGLGLHRNRRAGTLRYRLRLLTGQSEGRTAAPSAAVAAPARASRIVVHCDRPSLTFPTVVRSNLSLAGWALSPSGIRSVEALVDGVARGRVFYGALRPDVARAHPEYPDAEHSGFVGAVPVADLEDGEHSLVIAITADDGERLELRTRFQVDSSWLALGEVPDLTAQYQEWLKRHTPTPSELARARVRAARLRYRPTISLVVPVYNPSERALLAMVESVRAQVYDQWELCLADDASTSAHVPALLARLAAEDPRIKMVRLPEHRGIVGASNAALALASGEFVGLLDHDDLLSPLALYEVALALNEAPDLDLIYSDEDKVDDRGFRWDPFFKPDWSPDLLLSMNYVSHFGVYRRALVADLGGFRPGFDGSQDYDLVLRVTERTRRIHHIPSVLYSWRASAGSTARDAQAKPYALAAARRALEEALERRGIAGCVEPGCAPGRWRVRYALNGQPGVTIVLPTGGKLQFLRPCLESLFTQSSYPNFQVLIVDNSEGSAVADLYAELAERHPNLHYREFRLKPFNYPAINNYAVQFVDTPYLILLNDDITVITPDWIEAMLEHAQRPEVGVVGAKLLFPDETIQHAGVILGPYDNSGHAFKHFPATDPGYFDLPHVIRNCSAVTFACAMMRRELYEEVGGLDEVNLRVAFNDVDFCLRVRERGHWNVYTPYAVLYHHESVTKQVMVEPGEVEYMRRRWGHVIRHDPFYNPNLTRKGEDYSINLG